MKTVARALAALVLAIAGAAAYLVIYGNASSALRNGCYEASANLRPVGDDQPHLRGFPPRFACQYRTKTGRLVERLN